jgi:hypothetical protein
MHRNLLRKLLTKIRTLKYRAQSERIAGISGLTQTDWYVILNAAVSILTARANAGISTFLRDASLIRRAVRINHAFRTAIGWYSYVILQAGARGLIVDNLAFGVESTWIGEARVYRWHRHNCKVTYK